MDEAVHFPEMARKYMDSLYSYARVLSRAEGEAEDLLQETLLRAFRSIGTLTPGLSPKPWLFAIMRNAHIDRCRRERVRPACEALPDDEAPGAGEAGLRLSGPLDPEEILLRRLSIEEVRNAIRRLPTICREVVELREIEGLTYREIAQVIQRPIGTVMSRLYRGRNLLRGLLEGPAIPTSRPERLHGV